MKFLKKNIYKLILLTFLVVIPVISFAAVKGDAPLPEISKIDNPIKANTINGLIKTLLEGFLEVGIPLIALAIIYCGFLFVSARGNSEKITAAKDALLYTLIGAGILLGAWSIAQVISDTVLAL